MAEVREHDDEFTQKILLQYPTVYIIYAKTGGGYRVYVGETNDIAQRTHTHLASDPRLAKDTLLDALNGPLESGNLEPSVRRALWWRDLKDNESTILVIGHSLFNKSMTLEVEDRLMLHLSAIADVREASTQRIFLNNARRNIQTAYFTQDYVDDVFTKIWLRLKEHDPDLFPLEQLVRDSALFKASPFHQLNEQQVGAKIAILDAVGTAMSQKNQDHDTEPRLILVRGGAGTGKTVLLSSVFYDLAHQPLDLDDPEDPERLDVYLLVNHDEQVTVYQQIAERLGLGTKKTPRVMKPTRFINTRTGTGQIADVVLVDEAHLLWTQGKQSYRGDNQLKDILGLARVVVAVFDPMQVLARNQFWSDEGLRALEELAGEENCLELDKQMRIDSEGPAEEWIRDLVYQRVVRPIPRNDKYRIEIFESPEKLHAEVKARSESGERSEVEKGLSRLIATYDWEYKKDAPKSEDGATWDVEIGDFRLPWNRQQKGARDDSKRSWAEQAHTIDEVGSIFTIQGFDLNYAGVILGPSVIYREGRIQFESSASWNKNVTSKRTVEVDGEKRKLDVSEDLLRNQLNVLLTRGVRGMGIYAVDDELREALIRAQRGDLLF
ncbi:DNA/RNA helicase domain-containing protein [Corynebacterium qintianiae]|uniref:DNA/RNA helicase domain-containing protein n=1 Tax=Corynebacterium qintianiae TaxID=2709392 RepID=UPI0013EC94AE|nr:DNA/RNA helicase domain-containing protein [Corynebacterium qintianiae]